MAKLAGELMDDKDTGKVRNQYVPISRKVLSFSLVESLFHESKIMLVDTTL